MQMYTGLPSPWAEGYREGALGGLADGKAHESLPGESACLESFQFWIFIRLLNYVSMMSLLCSPLHD